MPLPRKPKLLLSSRADVGAAPNCFAIIDLVACRVGRHPCHRRKTALQAQVVLLDALRVEGLIELSADCGTAVRLI
jgi:hypothetical protein